MCSAAFYFRCPLWPVVASEVHVLKVIIGEKQGGANGTQVTSLDSIVEKLRKWKMARPQREGASSLKILNQTDTPGTARNT
jgi:hypothetical protein